MTYILFLKELFMEFAMYKPHYAGSTATAIDSVGLENLSSPSIQLDTATKCHYAIVSMKRDTGFNTYQTCHLNHK